MRYLKIRFMVSLLLVVSLLAGCSPSTSEKDVIGKWNNTKIDNLWMEFYADKTSTGGKWSLTKDGRVEIINPDGTKRIGILKEGKLIFEEFGDRGIFVRETAPK